MLSHRSLASIVFASLILAGFNSCSNDQPAAPGAQQQVADQQQESAIQNTGWCNWSRNHFNGESITQFQIQGRDTEVDQWVSQSQGAYSWIHRHGEIHWRFNRHAPDAKAITVQVLNLPTNFRNLEGYDRAFREQESYIQHTSGQLFQPTQVMKITASTGRGRVEVKYAWNCNSYGDSLRNISNISPNELRMREDDIFE